MVGRGEGKLVVWPHYFDKSLTRAQGRRVPSNVAIDEPRVHDVAQAARTLGLKVEIDEEARPPAFWHSRKGRVIIPKNGKKEEILKQIASRL